LKDDFASWNLFYLDEVSWIKVNNILPFLDSSASGIKEFLGGIAWKVCKLLEGGL
jgi:hypothetical protein